MNKYQVMPSLSEQEFAELKKSIADHGVQVAVEYDEDGNILDGHHRVQACEELDIVNYPKVVKVGMNEAQKLDYAFMVNATRRQLSREQKQDLIRQQLKRTPEKSDRQIAELVGVNHETVGNQRKELVGRGEIRHTDKVVDSIGRLQPRKPITVYQPTETTVSAAKELTENAALELVNAVSEGKVPMMQAHSVMSGTSKEVQQEALRRFESGKAKFLMEGVNQQLMETAYNIPPETREEIEEEVKKSDADIDRKFDIAKSLDKAIHAIAGLSTNDLPEHVRIYMDCDLNFDLEIMMLNLRMAQQNLMILQQEFQNSKKLKVVK